jgi:hypothetical protein
VKRLGPELKMPKLKASELKVPPFLSDLYFDLRERRLLPLVALILVAIVAAPILLGGDSGEPEPAPAPGPVAGASSAPAAHGLAVVQAQPGLRNYRKRLAHRSATNPFEQRFDGPQVQGAQLNEPTTTTTTTSTSAEATGGSAPSSSAPSGGPAEPPSGGGGAGDGGGSGDPAPSTGVTYYTFAVDLQITRTETKKDGTVDKGEPVLHEDVRPPAALPGDKAQVVTYMGTSSKTHKPLFLISPKVESVFGEGRCIAGEESCQLIELEPAFPETFVFGENQVRYKINVLKVTPVITGHS